MLSPRDWLIVGPKPFLGCLLLLQEVLVWVLGRARPLLLPLQRQPCSWALVLLASHGEASGAGRLLLALEGDAAGRQVSSRRIEWVGRLQPHGDCSSSTWVPQVGTCLVLLLLVMVRRLLACALQRGGRAQLLLLVPSLPQAKGVGSRNALPQSPQTPRTHQLWGQQTHLGQPQNVGVQLLLLALGLQPSLLGVGLRLPLPLDAAGRHLPQCWGEPRLQLQHPLTLLALQEQALLEGRQLLGGGHLLGLLALVAAPLGESGLQQRLQTRKMGHLELPLLPGGVRRGRAGLSTLVRKLKAVKPALTRSRDVRL